MTMFKSMAFAGTVAALSSLSFAWSIDGTITSEGSGRALSGVKITSFNYAGIESTSGADGTFTISNEKAGLHSAMVAKAFIGFSNNIITISGVKAQTITVSVMDALGKVCASKTEHNIDGFMQVDLNKTMAKGAKFLRINADGNRATYQIGKTVTLMKEGDPLPFLQFSLEGYQNATYQAKAEVETGVIVKMAKASAQSSSSKKIESSSSAKVSSSSVEESSSSAKIEQIIVDCAGKTVKPVDRQNMDVTVDGKKRTFIMHVPSAYKGDKPVPLVIDYHPIGGSGSGEFGSSPYKAKTDPEGVITLYPDGTGKPGGMGNGWNVGPCCSNDDDVKFSYAMIDKLKEIACIDPQRIYATGFSMGGGMSNHVACMMSDVFAAVAPAAMDLNKTNSAQCKMSRPISVINFRGTNDPVCRYQGGDSGFNDGLNFLGAEGTFKFWAEKNGCTGSPTKNSNGCQEYSNCKDGTKVVLCTKQGGGHDYGDASIGWPFLKQFTLPASFVK
ncbi:polyhydroxybutyrate depolymerase [Fibrobacter sp. UWB16]|uniref:prolyl oligopeptidase family serine peptidase n=1 Tax=unclassified Fibrobacter TaxID=2634177 RepID=UPI000B527731|nr:MULTISPECIES: prolyl oligopeptidase family serine peptidase [unclassified Fibrobacter]OWV19243.1 feruloyl esterase [Fibrobacter sp. UWB3]SOD15998.1 polyhydroxybutyrate depolymerase [Fibrobacter sp. UWB16]